MQPGLDAGDFGTWLRQARAALRGTGGSTVPCGECTGCCTSSYSLEVRPTDAALLERIPAASLYRPRGGSHWTVRPNADGTCPMLDCNRCTIYPDRPQTCLDYDCRVFAAAGIDAGGEDKAVINRRVAEWRFGFAQDADREAHGAIRAAAAFIRSAHDAFPPGSAPRSPLGVAALALSVYPVFMPPGPAPDTAATVRAVLAARAAFDSNSD